MIRMTQSLESILKRNGESEGMIHWFAHGIGLDSGSGYPYLFWSGFGSDLAYSAAIAVAWRHLNCHAKGCFRLGRHPIVGTPFKVCGHHHPDVPDGGASAEHIAASSSC